MELDDLKNFWKNKTSGVTPVQSGDFLNIIDELRSNEKATKTKYIIASAAMAVELLVFLVLIFWGNIFSGMSLAGILLIITAVVLGGISIWSTNIIFTKSDLENPGIDFLKNITDKLERRKFMRIYLVPSYLIMIAFGVTMIFSQKLSTMELEWKVFIYFITYLYIILIYFFTSKRELKKEKNVIEPLKKNISILISQLESDK